MRVIPESEIDQLLNALGASIAPRRRDGVRLTLTFFDRYLAEKSWETRLSFLKAMDLSQPVRIVDLLPGETVVAFRHHAADWGEFHTRLGTDPRTLGITTDARQLRRFEVVQRVAALESTAAPYLHMSRGRGGGLQLVIPQAWRHLRIAQRGSTTW